MTAYRLQPPYEAVLEALAPGPAEDAPYALPEVLARLDQPSIDHLVLAAQKYIHLKEHPHPQEHAIYERMLKSIRQDFRMAIIQEEV